MKLVKNIPASIQQRLLNYAKHDKRSFNELLQYYAMERFLYRLSQSAYAHCFILKGALMLRVWRFLEFRPTMDVDLLGKTSNETINILSQIQEIIAMDVEPPDGLTFDPNSIQCTRIAEEAVYAGIRVRFRGRLDLAIVVMQLDISFSDILYPGPLEQICQLCLTSQHLSCFAIVKKCYC